MNIKNAILDYLKFERDERIPELIEMYDEDVEYVINKIWGPLETILDGKTDEDLVKIIDDILNEPEFENKFEEWKEWNSGETDLEALHCNYVWEYITNP
jgi:hypothetical protein